jgi:peptide/nickel transport system substrate-binding protein
VDECVLVPNPPIYGVGPWFISQYTDAGLIVLEPNPHYTGPYPAQVEKIIIRYFADPDGMVSALQNGEIDIAWRALNSEQITQFEGIPGVTIGSFPGGGIRFLFLNHAMAPMDDENVVKAIASAIDRDEIIETIFGGNAIPIYSMVPPGIPGATEAFDTLYSAPNLDQSKQFLKASGYSYTNNLVLDLWYPNDHWNCSAWMELIAQQLEATGAIVNLHWRPWSEYSQMFDGGNSYTAGAGGWGMDYPDPADFLDPFTYNGGSGNNITSAQEGSTFGVPINEKAQSLVELHKQMWRPIKLCAQFCTSRHRKFMLTWW